ncbi:MAG: DUF2157 domain-containing protein [Oscillatoriaceae bacterium SKW80]|nr:DUF2157 domain-containing protein [Oscillatoriaceae bacterium SKYG93]MCX8120732.1 DUF2157 domain-containing protein [Oscillatoriaceae bacterium SKW80]MDW8453730.1 DUF2157 domain-containing protein [Oscillatoriaceae cyanobacterium SKYGB_i_bin93]HIK26962.1 DUF2157 domain-containing protein [Oscillatoriaceae cyanobacterium M7585_C2015_266]
MVSEKFRYQLRQEVEQWRAEGLIDAQLYRQLEERYQFDSLEIAARNRFIGIFMGLGGILLGLGAIAFVAANWQVWSREFRVMLLLSVFVGVNAAGFYLWRIAPVSNAKINTEPSQTGWQQRLGEGLLLLGAILLGANMALMAQMFHIGGSLFELYLVWGLGVLAMAYSLRLTSLGVMAILLSGCGYLLSVFDWNSKQDISWVQILIQHAPLAATLLFIPLAYWCRSRIIFALGANAVIFPLLTSISQGLNIAPGFFFALAYTLPPALLWGYDDRNFPTFLCSRIFQPLARRLALVFLSILFYFSSFNLWSNFPSQTVEISKLLSRPLIIDIIILGAIAIWEWFSLARREKKNKLSKSTILTSKFVAFLMAIATLTSIFNLSIYPIPELTVFIFNLLLFFLATALIREGLTITNRRFFWGGMLLLTLQIISRTIEYNTDLILKALAFFACGIAVIAAGLWFERYSSRLKPSKENSL